MEAKDSIVASAVDADAEYLAKKIRFEAGAIQAAEYIMYIEYEQLMGVDGDEEMETK